MNTRISRRRLIQAAATTAGGMSFFPNMMQRAFAQENGNIKRVVIWYVPEGASQQAFWPSNGPGALDINMAASIDGKNPLSRNEAFNQYRRRGTNSDGSMGTYCLQPLKEHESDLTLISGFNNAIANVRPHKEAVEQALTGNRPNQGSIDQHLGELLRGSAPFSSIFSSVYGSHIGENKGADYASPFRTTSGNAASNLWNPVQTYLRVFPNGIDTGGGGGTPVGATAQQRATLDLIQTMEARLDDIKCIGGEEAYQKMESYLESLQQLEQDVQAQITAAENDIVPISDVSVDINSSYTPITSNNKYWYRSDNFTDLVKIQIDTTVAALALNKTRCSLMQFSASGDNDGTQTDKDHYIKAGITGLEGSTMYDHHLGHDPDQVRRRDQARVFRWWYSQLSYFIDRLKATPDGSGTLFDSTLVVCCSEFGMYNHRTNDVPYMLVGNPNNNLQKGVYIDAHGGNAFRRPADFYLGIARSLGLDMPSFGESSTPYTGFLS